MNTKENIRLFAVKVLPATNTKGTRVLIHDTRNNKRKTISWDYSLNTSADIASKYLESVLGIELLPFKSYNESNGVSSLFTQNFINDLN
jgi:hypothetical protein